MSALKKIYSAIIFVFVSLNSLQAQNNCKLKKDQDSIKVYTCHTDTSRFKSIIAELTVKTTLDELQRFIVDIPNYTQWQYNTVEANVIRKISESELIYRTVIEAPWPVVNRDMVVHIQTKYTSNNEFIITTESENGIMPEKKEFVRVPSSHAKWIVMIKNKNQLQIKYTMQIDPGGAVPAWLVNWVCAEAPYQSFKKLKGLLEKKK
jgi:hypothetical protein